jgi:hypothetical protein
MSCLTDKKQWQSTTSDIIAIVADTTNSIRAVFPRVSSTQWAQSFTTSSLLDVKPGAVFCLSYPEVRISDCFDPARVEIWVKNFSLCQNGGVRRQREQLLEVSTLPVITERLGRFMRHRLVNTMARLASNSAVDSSPGLKSQVSAKGDSDVENMSDPLVSQTDFATQIPFSPPKPLETGPPRKAQLLGKRIVMGDLRQLVSDSGRAPKKNKTCTDEKRASVEPNIQTDVERGGAMATSIKSTLKCEGLPNGQDAGSGMTGLGRSSERKVVQALDTGKDDSTNRQLSPPRSASNTISEIKISHSDDHLDTLARWRDRLTKTTYLPRYLQTIPKAQNDLLATEDKWQPALIGQPTRPGTLPLELLNSLTAAVDQKAMLVSEPVQSNQQVSAIHQEISPSEAGGVDKEPDLPSNSPILRTLAQGYDQNQSEAQEPESESEVLPSQWSLSPPPSTPPRRRLPPDSSPLLAPPNLPVPSSPAEGASHLIGKFEDPVVSSFVEFPSIEEGEESSQGSRHHSNNPEGSVNTHMSNLQTSSSLQEKPASRLIGAAAGVSNSQAEANSASCSEIKSPSIECVTIALDPTPTTNSSDNLKKCLELNNINLIHVSDTSRTARQLTSSAPQPQWRQIARHSLTTLPRETASQQFPPHSSPQLIPGTFLHEIFDSRLAGSLQDFPTAKKSVENFEIDSSEDGSVHDADINKSFPENHDRDEQADASQQVILDIQNASQVTSVAPRSPESAGDGTTAPSNHAYSVTRAVSEDRVMFASDPNSLVKRSLENPDSEELSKHPKRENSAVASSALSGSSEEPDFRRVDNMTRRYRRTVFSTLRKKDTAASPLQRSTIVLSNGSPQSDSIQSSNRRHSAQTSILRQVTTLTPLTSMSAQAQKAWGEGPASTSDMPRRSSLLPENQFSVFQTSYPTYEGNFTQFLMSCRMIKKIRAAGKVLPQGVWDDFVYRHNHDYRSYLLDTGHSNELESPMPYEEYYADCVSEPVHLKGVLRLAFINTLSVEMDSAVRLDTTPVRTAFEPDHPEGHRRSIAASSSASNIPTREALADRPDKVTPKDESLTLESQLQLQEQEEARQIQSSSVHLWLQKASGAASPELGTLDRLVAPGDIARFDLTENDDDFTFNLARELLPLTTRSASTRKSARRDSVERGRLPDAKTQPFKHFALGHARLDVDKYERSHIQTDTKGSLRPEVQRIVDIFTWRG